MSVRVMTDVWSNSTHTGNELLVLLKLADCADEATRVAWPSVPTLAHAARLHPRTVQRMLRKLQASGELQVVATSTPFASTRYRIGCEGGDNPPRGGLRTALGMACAPPEPSVEPSVKPPIRPPTGDAIDLFQVRHVWDTWIQSTGRKQSKLDGTRIALIRRTLKKYPQEDLCDAVRGWERSDWHRGENPSGKKYNDIELLLRINASTNNVEKFRDLWRETDRPIDRTSVRDFLAR